MQFGWFAWISLTQLKVLKCGSQLSVPAVVNQLRHQGGARSVPWEQVLQGGALCVLVLSKYVDFILKIWYLRAQQGRWCLSRADGGMVRRG